MKGLKLENISERQQVLAVILMAGMLIFALWFFLLLPLNRQRHRLQREIEEMASFLASRNFMLPEEVLGNTKQKAYDANRRIHDDWLRLMDRMATFPNQQALVESSVGHIDFKVALFQVRQRLLGKSRALNIELPRDLGMDDSVTGNEDARRLMLHLRAVEKLADLALDLKISRLRHLEPMEPIQHRAGQNTVFMEEYPVRIDFEGTIENVYSLFNAVMEPGHVFVVKNLRVENPSQDGERLQVSAVLSALLFTRDPDEVIPPPRKVTTWVPPKGI
jgi:hypothetical protein